MRIAIVDDDKEWRQQAYTMAKKCFAETDVVIECFASGDEFLEKNKGYDILLLDIEMPGKDGFETAHAYRVSYPDVILILLTTHLELSRKGYEVNAFRYVDKLCIQEELKSAFDLTKKMLGRNKIIEINLVNIGRFPLCLKDIVYIETSGRKCIVYTYDNSYECSDSVKSLDVFLSEDGFYRCHKSYIVNLDAIKRIEQNAYGAIYAHMAGGHKVMVAVRRYPELKKKYVGRKYEYANS